MAKLSFTTMATPDRSSVEVIQMAKRYGYQGVDMRLGSYKSELQMDSSIKAIRELRNIFDTEGILPSGLLCYAELDKKEPSCWEKFRDEIYRCLDISFELGSPSIRIWLSSPKQFDDSYGYIHRAVEMLAEILDKDKSGVSIILQNHRKKVTALELAEIITKVGSPRLGMAFSPEHSVIGNENLNEVCNAVRPFTKQLYIADVKLRDSEYTDVLPGKGDVPIGEIYDTFGGENFKGWVTFKWEKIWAKDLEEPEIALPYFVQFWRHL
ncbi:MAG TPA: sugar phosphate isomerase/epimerase [Clostridiaceae bacterium]|nr:sugar phosphate isomerase/epimerase [Clostridiaceae bacterium]